MIIDAPSGDFDRAGAWLLHLNLRVLAYAIPPMAAALIGMLVVVPRGSTLLLAIAGVVWFAFWSLHWRSALLGLFLFIPVAAVPGILLQQQGWPTLLKDGLFLLPGYIGLVMTVAARRTFRWPLSTALTILVVGLVLIVVVEAIRVVTLNAIVALIGIKTWLLYVPLLIAPAAAFASIWQVQRFIRLLAIVSLLPSVVALLQFVLVFTGHQDLAYGWYGVLSGDVTQQFAQVGISEQILLTRIPSTFQFVTQFVAYCLLTTPICLVSWMSDPDRRWRYFAACTAILIVAAGFASGSRTYYLWGPIEVGLMAVLIARRRLQVLITIISAGVVAAFTIGTELGAIALFITNLGWHYLVVAQAGEFLTVYQIGGLLGIGAGLDTGASRYVLPSHALPYGIEGWYALTFLELGFLGLVVVILIWSIVLRHAWTGVVVTRGSAAGPLAACAFVILLATVLNLYKGVSLEYDPLNVYFWSIAGLAIALPRIANLPNGRQSIADTRSGLAEKLRPR